MVTAAREKAEIEGLVVEAGPEKALAILADVADPEDCERVMAGTVERFGKVDVLVNNAGRGMKDVSPAFLTEPTRFWEADHEVWKMVVDTNVNGPFSWLGRSCPGCWRRAAGAS